MENTSHFRLNDSVTQGSVPISPWSPGSANLFSKIPQQINNKAWELWFAQGLTLAGDSAFAIGFFRDGSSSVQKGGFRVEVHTLFPDTTYYNTELLFPESIITEVTTGHVIGKWQSFDPTNGILSSATFNMAPDLSEVRLDFDVVSKVSGYVVLKPAFSKSSSIEILENEEDAKLGPHVYYLRPLPLGLVEADLTFPQEKGDRKLSIHQGLGRVDRVWSHLPWPLIMSRTFHLSASVGPYRIHVASIVSTTSDGKLPYSSARIFDGNVLVCNPQHVTVEPKNSENDDDGVRGVFEDKSTGCKVVLVQSGNRWEFDVRNLKAMWNIAIGSGGKGNAGFLVSVQGGLVEKVKDNPGNLQMHSGFGTCAHVEL